jgi:hypothetical protein
MDQKIREYMHSYPFESFPTLDDEPPFAFLQRHLFPLFLKISKSLDRASAFDLIAFFR